MPNTKKAKGRRKNGRAEGAIGDIVHVERRARDSERSIMDDICNEYRSRFPTWVACSDADYAACLPCDPNVILDVPAGVPRGSPERAAAALDVAAVNQRLLRYITFCSERAIARAPVNVPRSLKALKVSFWHDPPHDLQRVADTGDRMGKNKKKAKEDRLNNKGWAEGCCEERVLLPNVDRYTSARQRGHISKRRVMADICNQYHTYFPLWLEDHHEYHAVYRPYDPNVIVDVTVGLTEDEKEVALLHMDWLNMRLRLYMKYRSSALLISPHVSFNYQKNPLANLLLTLSGFERRPRRRTGPQQYQHENHDALQSAYEAEWKKQLLEGTRAPNIKQSAQFRGRIVSAQYEALPVSEQEAYLERAIAEGDAVRAEYDKLRSEGPSVAPAARQKAINALPAFTRNIMRGQQGYTGLVGASLFGGPIPAAQGEITAYSIFAGTNLAGQSWMDFDPEGLAIAKDQFLKFVKTCYTQADCDAAALEDVHLPLDLDSLMPLPEFSDSDDDSDGSGSESDEEPTATSKKRKRASTKAKPAAAQAKAAAPSKSKTAKGKASATAAPAKKTKSQTKTAGEQSKSSSKPAATPTATPTTPPEPAQLKPRGAFDVRCPAETYKSSDPPRKNEGYRRLAWEFQAYLDFIRYMEPSSRTARSLAWTENHYVDDQGFVRDRTKEYDEEMEAALNVDSDDDYVDSDEETQGSKKKKKKLQPDEDGVQTRSKASTSASQGKKNAGKAPKAKKGLSTSTPEAAVTTGAAPPARPALTPPAASTSSTSLPAPATTEPATSTPPPAPTTTPTAATTSAATSPSAATTTSAAAAAATTASAATSPPAGTAVGLAGKLTAIRDGARRAPPRRGPPPALSRLVPTLDLTPEEMAEEEDDPDADMDVDKPSAGFPSSHQTSPRASPPRASPPRSTAPSAPSSATDRHAESLPALLDEELEEEDMDPGANMDEDDIPTCPDAAKPWFQNIFNVMNQPDLGEEYCKGALAFLH
ncbi:uncharacterized protein SCHCODRAFT_01080467 [Schizophyllum commune H4-8]|nr:uncharacterized protein SCHCODRAFT_01080467 [Schizophyllum commune H4-8]KAI5897295.1 hypothetical protein SCHCODRAFT_01080467 [Schizophyllum commune H4-8]